MPWSQGTAVPGHTWDSGPCQASPCGVALDWFKVCVLSPTPAPGLIKSHWDKATNTLLARSCCHLCPFSDGTMGSASFLKKAQALLRVRNQLARECLAELLSVFVLMLITLSGSAQMVTTSETKGNYLSAYLAGALAIMVAIHTGGGVSGAHLNPAYSFAMCLLEQFPWWKFPIYVAVQTLGSFIAAGAVYFLYYDAIWHYSNGTLTTSGPRETASIFATYPADYVSIANGFLDQVGAGVGCTQTPPVVPIPAVLSCRAGPAGDRHRDADLGRSGHHGHPQQACPQGPGVSGRGPAGALHRGLHGRQLWLPHEPCAGFRTPALHLRGRLGRGGLQVGRGTGARWGVAGVIPCPPCPVSSRGNGWWWVPLVAPLLGAVVGSALYQLFVAFHHPAEEGNPQDEQNSLVLVSTTIPSDTKMSPGKKDEGVMLSQKK
ncbi:aquaporin-10 isoform X1 [Rissa tridactyla]|uniref:aquaporin-10 isoform X1 n=2 Tax=Rissa tridactyla TaxID=75485 RepID=UPI0023BAA02C|nr:aquaporin-10 isoform X1 [Rissa tridactyla]